VPVGATIAKVSRIHVQQQLKQEVRACVRARTPPMAAKARFQ
jgi:hypothetical protein